MRKVVIAGFAVALAVALVSGALATGPGAGMMHDHTMGAAVTPEQAQKYAQFEKEIVPLRQKMLQLRADLMALRAQEKPDWKAIADNQKAMVDIRTEIQKKAAEAGIAGHAKGMCGCGMDGMGMGARGTGRMGMGRMAM